MKKNLVHCSHYMSDHHISVADIFIGAVTNTNIHTDSEDYRSTQLSATYFTASQVQRCIQVLIF